MTVLRLLLDPNPATRPPPQALPALAAASPPLGIEFSLGPPAVNLPQQHRSSEASGSNPPTQAPHEHVRDGRP